jgi:hypothetical protein
MMQYTGDDARCRDVKWGDIEHRRGRFSMSFWDLKYCPVDALRVMSQCIISRCRCDWSRARFDYEAYSLLFDEIPQGYKAPRYTIMAGPSGIVCKREVES